MYRNKRFKASNTAAFKGNKDLSTIKENQSPAPVRSQRLAEISKRNIVESPLIKNSNIDIQSQIDIHHYSNDPVSRRRENIEEEDDFLGSQQSIPASQPPTQRRYLSQRGCSMSITKTQSKLFSKAPDSYFEMVLIKTGVNIENTEQFVLCCDPLTYVNNLSSFLKKHHEYPENIKIFIEGFKEYLNNPLKEIKLLSGCLINIPNIGTEYQSQDSMTMNFMMISFLQEKIVDVLLEKIESSSSESQNFISDVPVLPLLLTQLKFVTSVYSEKLYQRILKIYENATAQGRNEIILSAEFILDASKHEEFVQYLIDNSGSIEELLSKENVKSFSNLYLSSIVQTNIRKKIINYVQNGCNSSLLAVFMKFLLKFLHDDDENLFELVADIRTALDWKQTIQTEFDNLKYQLEIFTYIKQGLIRSKKLCDVWQKSIQGLSEESTKPVDIIIFLMLISIRDEKSLYIENLIRRQIKLEHIKLSLISETRKLFLPMLETYGDTFLHILYNFVKEKTHIVSEFAKNCFCIIFSIGDTYQKKILNKLVDLACNKYSKEIITIALDILQMLSERFSAELQNYGSLLLPMLDQVNEIPLKQTRTVMKLLCSIAYPTLPLLGSPNLQEHIDMMIKKQVCSRSATVQKKGIIGMVQFVNCIVRTEHTQDNNLYDLNESYHTANDLPEGKGKLGASYILRVFSATNYSVNCLGLFYEELAIVLSIKNAKDTEAKVERHFLVWLCDLVTYYLQENFIKEIDKQSEEECGIEISAQKCQNSINDTITETDALNLAINIAEPVFIPSVESHSSVLILPPLFNLIAVVQKIKSSDSLEAVNAVLGCGIFLPKVLENESHIELSNNYGEDTARKILDIRYHTVNWYRVVISAFVSQDEELLRRKVLLRLRDLIELEEIIRGCLKEAPINYIPPLAQFNNFEESQGFNFKEPVGRAKKRKCFFGGNEPCHSKNTDEVVETEGMSILATAQTDKSLSRTSKICHKPTRQSQFSFYYGPKEAYRQLDDDIILLLREDFDLTYPQPEDQYGVTLGLKDFKFIMQDLVSKVESIPGVKKLGNDMLVQNISQSKYFMEKVETYLAQIYKNLEAMKKFILELLISVDGSLGNTALFTDQVNYVKVCFGLCIRFIASYFSYSGFDDVMYQKDLMKALNSICNKKSDNLIEAASNIIEQLLNFEPAVVEVKAGFYLYNAVYSMQRFLPKRNFEKKIRTMCKVFLCRKWYNFEGSMEKGACSNILLDEIIKGFLQNSSTKRFKEILIAVLTDCKGMKGKNDILKSFPNIHKGNFPMLFKRLCGTLIESTNMSISGNLSETESLKIWENCCNNLNILLDIIKSINIPRNYALYIKFSHAFIKLFLQHGLPSFEKSLRKDPERFNILLKNLQYNTRFLHNLCCHSKAIKNNVIVAQIPFVRETIENLLYKVKAALAMNSCVSAFWMGPLKNKDIQGEEIHLPEPLIDVINSQNNEDVILDEDSSDADETFLDNNLGSVAKKTDKNQSISDCF